MDSPIKHIVDECHGPQKWERECFSIGQVCVFLASCYVSDDQTGRIRAYCARLVDVTPFRLSRNNAGYVVKDDETAGWQCRTVFPTDCQRRLEDPLSYMCCSNDKSFFAFCKWSNRRPFADAFTEAALNPVNFRSIDQLRNSGMRLEALVSGAIVLASHAAGFNGIQLGPYLSNLQFELGVCDSVRAIEGIPAGFEEPIIKYLGPPNVKWPSSLEGFVMLGTLSRVKNHSQCDISSGDSFSAECKYYSKQLNLECVSNILGRVPSSICVHLVVTNKLQGSYFRHTSFDTFIKGIPSSMDAHVY